MRDGNYPFICVLVDEDIVVSLPMRDGNLFFDSFQYLGVWLLAYL